MRNVALRVSISLLFVGLLFYFRREDIPQIVRALKNVDRFLITLSAALFLSTTLILAWRLRLIFEAESVRIRFWEVTRLTFIGYFFNNFLPTSVGGDIVKAMCASRLTGQTMKSVTSVLMDRIFGLFTFVLIPSISLLFFLKQVGNSKVPILIYSFLLLAVFFFTLLFNRNLARRFKFVEKWLDWLRLGKKAREIYESLHAFRRRKGVMAAAVFLSVLGQGISIFVLYLMALAMGADASPVYFYLLVPVVHLVSMVPISLNGLGIRELAYSSLLAPYIGAEIATALGILWLGLLFLLSLIGAMIYLFQPKYHIRWKEATD